MALYGAADAPRSWQAELEVISQRRWTALYGGTSASALIEYNGFEFIEGCILFLSLSLSVSLSLSLLLDMCACVCLSLSLSL